MIPAVAALRDGCPAELSRPDDERILEQTVRFEIPDQAGDRFVNLAGVLGISVEEFAVLIPLVAVSALNKPDSALGEAPGKQALPAEILRDGIVEPVEFLRPIE